MPNYLNNPTLSTGQELQVKIFKWLKNSYPELPAWHTVSIRQQNAAMLNRNKLLGLPSGAPHVFVGAAVKYFHGFFATIKPRAGHAETDNQRKLRVSLEKNGYHCCIVHSLDEFIREFESYLGVEK